MLRVCALSFLLFHIGNTASVSSRGYSELDVPASYPSNSSNETWTGTDIIEIGSRSTVDSNGCRICSRNYLVGKEKVTFNTAVLLCNQLGMEIASPMSAAEENAIKQTCASTAPGIEQFWLGGKRCSDCLSQFRWISSGKPAVYTDFLPSQPDNSQNNENCIELLFVNKIYGWNDLNCDIANSFVCQSKCCCNNN